MSYTSLAKTLWTSGAPKIYFTPSYEYSRSGADMKYRIRIVIASVSGNSYFGYPIYLDLSLDGSRKVSGKALKSSSPRQWTSAITWTSDEFTVSNKTSGKTSLTVRLYSGNGSTRDESYSFSLDISPAASTLANIAAFELGDVIDVGITKYAAYYDTLTVRYGSTTLFTQDLSGAAGSHTISVDTGADAFYTAMAAAASGSFSFILTTKTSATGNSLGSSTKTAIGTVPADIVPSASLSVSPTGGNEWVAAKGVYIQGKSKVYARLTGAAGHGSAVASYAITHADQVTTGQEYTSAFLQTAGAVILTGTVTDKRGRAFSSLKEINVLAYQAPYISEMSCARGVYNAQQGTWTADESGSDIRLLLKPTFSLADIGNQCKADVYIDGVKAVSAAVSSGESNSIFVTGVDGETEHELTVVLSDLVGGSNEKGTALMSLTVNGWDVYDDGKGVTFGAVATQEGFDCHWDAEFRKKLKLPGGTVTDYVTETGASDFWEYRIWASGKCECWGVKDYGTVDITTANGNIFHGNTLESVSFPIALSALHCVQMAPVSTGFWLCGPTEEITKDDIPPLTLMRPAGQSKAVKISFYIVGEILQQGE